VHIEDHPRDAALVNDHVVQRAADLGTGRPETIELEDQAPLT
jgi:hypothetical protein